jgi:superfamily II DNA or RNA helicase
MNPIVRCRLDAELVLFDLPAKTSYRLYLKLSVRNPEQAKLLRFHGHGGGLPERLHAAIEMPDGSLHVPRGARRFVREELVKDGLALGIAEDAMSDGATVPRRAVEQSRTPRDYQAKALQIQQREKQGLVVLGCGGGKTLLGVVVVCHRPITTLIIVPTIDLIAQWVEELQFHGFDPGVVADGRDERHRGIVVGTIDSLLPILEADAALDDGVWGARFGRVIIDEAHRTAAPTMQRALRFLPARERLGLTATPNREDGLTDLVTWAFGDTLLTRTPKELIAAGYLMPATIVAIATGFTWSYDGPEKKRLSTLERDLEEDLGRNMLIADTVAAKAKAGAICLVLVRARAHAKELAAMICLRGIEAKAVTGQTAKKKRAGSIADLTAGTLSVMIATSLADEGLNIPRLSLVALAAPRRSEGKTTQRLGRLLRLWPGKAPELYDFVDEDVDTLARRAQARRKVYRDVGLLP